MDEKEEKKIEPAAPTAEIASTPAQTAAVEAPKAEAPKTSAESLNGPFPAELNNWNWGAFFLNWIWSIGNSTWIGLLALISPISLIVMIILGIKGNEWAWNNRKFESVDQFKAVQKKWAVWGLVLFLISIVLSIIAMTSTAILSVKTAREKAINLETNLNANTSVETPVGNSTE